MARLFCVRLPDNTLLVADPVSGQPAYFGSKAEAKAVRDQHDDAVVVLGPDHKRYRGA